jgi:hypothetical protein
LTSCLTGPRFTPPQVDPILELERSLAQTEMALSVAEMQYMLWTWSVTKGDTTFQELDQVKMASRIIQLRETEKLIADELKRRTNGK